jgi:hypothetical protein
MSAAAEGPVAGPAGGPVANAAESSVAGLAGKAALVTGIWRTTARPSSA